jgi:hypothetical protein
MAEREKESRRGGMVELRFRIPLSVAIWLSEKAEQNFKHRNNYLKDLLIAMYRRDNGR